MTGTSMTAAQMAAGVRTGRLAAIDLVDAALAAIDRLKPLNAVTALHSARARAKAEAVDHLVVRGDTLGPLAGVPFAVKNLFDVKGSITRAGSRVTETNAPASRDAFVIRALEEAGAVLVASTNMDELAYGFSGENGHDGDTRNPYDRSRSAGGSSSGSAALVAAGAVPLALGTDTNGSIRVPAALSGVVGLKPTYGRLSRRGVYPFVRSLDHVGLFAATVEDAALAYDAMQGRDLSDPAQSGQSTHPSFPSIDQALGSVARLGGFFGRPLHRDVEDVMRAASNSIGAISEVVLDQAEVARAASFVLTTAEGGQQHLKALIRHPERFGPLVRDRLRAGALVPAAWTGRAQKLRRLVTDDLLKLLSEADILLAPATPCPAFPLGVAEWDVAGETLPIRLDIGRFTQALTLTGVPIAVVGRVGSQSGLPVGVQLIGRPFEEARVLAAARHLEKAGFTVPLATPEAVYA